MKTRITILCLFSLLFPTLLLAQYDLIKSSRVQSLQSQLDIAEIRLRTMAHMFRNSHREIEKQCLLIAGLEDSLAIAKSQAIVVERRSKNVSLDLEELQRQYEQAEQDAAKWALRIRDPDAEPRSAIEGESTLDRDSRLRGRLKESVTQAFNLRMEIQQAQLNIAEAKLQSSQARLAKRKLSAEKIIQRRMNELLASEEFPNFRNVGNENGKEKAIPLVRQHENILKAADSEQLPASEHPQSRFELKFGDGKSMPPTALIEFVPDTNDQGSLIAKNLGRPKTVADLQGRWRVTSFFVNGKLDPVLAQVVDVKGFLFATSSEIAKTLKDLNLDIELRLVAHPTIDHGIILFHVYLHKQEAILGRYAVEGGKLKIAIDHDNRFNDVPQLLPSEGVILCEYERLEDQTENAASLLQFRIVANTKDHEPEIKMARRVAEMEPWDQRTANRFATFNNTTVRWVDLACRAEPLGTDANGDPKYGYRFIPSENNLVRDAATGKIVDLSQLGFNRDPKRDALLLTDWMLAKKISQLQVLVLEPSDDQNVTNSDLAEVSVGTDARGRNNILFKLTDDGAAKLGLLTKTHYGQQMGILVDGQLHLAPAIRDAIYKSGEISGDFTQSELQDLVNRTQIYIDVKKPTKSK